MTTADYVGKAGDPYTLIVDVDGTDLTGFTIRSQIRHTAEDRTILATFTPSIANQTTDLGRVYLRLTGVQTQPLAGAHVFDVEFTGPGADPDVWPQTWVDVTDIRFEPDVTR